MALCLAGGWKFGPGKGKGKFMVEVFLGSPGFWSLECGFGKLKNCVCFFCVNLEIIVFSQDD